MEISAIPTNLISNGSADRRPALAQFAAPILPVRSNDTEQAALSRPGQSDAQQNGRALAIFRQELKYSLFAQLELPFAAERTIYDAVRSALTPDDVVADTLGAATRLVAENADIASRALSSFRQRVEAAAVFTQETVGRDDDIDDLDDTLAKLDEGLEELDDEASRNVESRAVILSVDTRLEQRSTIRIRTQEGDIVRLDLKRSDRLAAEDIAVSNERVFATRTDVAVSSRSRFSLSVRGELNEAEFTAIQGVFAQAEAIADEFFGGDLAAAFGLASSLEFDTGQLARVNLRFRSRETSAATFAQLTEARAQPVVQTDAPIAPSELAPAPDPVPGATPALDVMPRAVEPDAQVENVVAPETTSDNLAAETPEYGFTPFLQFFELLADFLRNVSDGFELQARDGSATLRYHYSQSFKLTLLKSVLELTAPEESTDASVLAGALIDGLADGGETEKADG